MSTRRLNAKQHTLLLNSQVTKDYPWFFELLSNCDRITDEIVNNLNESQRNFFDNMLDLLITQAVTEWEADSDWPLDDMGDERIKCYLCGQPNRYIFYITNRLNGTSINVGSDCVTHFGINVEATGMTVTQLKKNATRLNRLNELNYRFPGINRLIQGKENYLNLLPIVVTAELEKTYIECMKKIEGRCEGYLKSDKPDESIFNVIQKLLDERDSLVLKIDQYVKSNLGRKFIPSRDIAIWLENKGDKQTLDRIKQSGQIEWGTAHRIQEPEFVKEMIPDFNIELEKLGMEIEGITPDAPRYIIRPSKKTEIRLVSRHNDFVFNFGWILFKEDPLVPLSLTNIVNNCTFYGDKSADLAVTNLKDLMKTSEVRIFAHYPDFNEIFFCDKDKNYFIKCELMEFLNKFKMAALGFNDNPTMEIVNYVKNLSGKRYTEEEIKDIQQLRERF